MLATSASYVDARPMTLGSLYSLARYVNMATLLTVLAGFATRSAAQAPALSPTSAESASIPLGIPKPGPATDAPYAPQPILPGGIVVPLYAPDSPRLNRAKIREAEKYNMGGSPGRIQSIVSIHN